MWRKTNLLEDHTLDKLRALKYFKRVVETQSFSQTAEEFSVPASSVSRRVKDLEQELGVELLHRSTRFVSTTELGNLYYQQVVKGLSQLSFADELVSQSNDQPKGVIRISAAPGLAEKILLPLLKTFRQQYPLLTLDINYTSDLSLFGQEAVDVAFRGGQIKDDRVIAKCISESPFVLVASNSIIQKYQLNDKQGSSQSDLLSLPVLMYRTKTGPTSWWQQEQGNWSKLNVTPYLVCNDRLTLVDAVLAGEGLMLTAKWVVDDELYRGDLKVVNTQLPLSLNQQQYMSIHLLYQQAKYPLPKVKLFVDHVLVNKK